MHKQNVLFFIFLCFVFTGFRSFSQITATPNHGCSPLNVTFSGPTGASAPSWTFGPGQGTSLLLNPSHIYVAPGTYNITYTAMVGGSPVTSNTQITVDPNPTGNFTYVLPSSHCVPMVVSFTGSGGAAGSTYNWLFNDLSISTGVSLTHTYISSGVYTPTMTIIDQVTGCHGTVTAGTFTVSDPPTVAISANPGLSSCTAPFSTSFSGANSSSGAPGGSPLTYNWSFPGASTAPPTNVATPGTATYPMGNFVVSLTVTDNNSCSNTASVAVHVSQPSLAVTVPGTVCINEPFTGTIQANQNITYWNMGDGLFETINLLNPSVPSTHTIHIYSTPGLKTATITVNSGTCVAQITKNIFVEQIVPSFTGVPTFSSCSSPFVANIINQSSVNTGVSLTYTWTANTTGAAYNHVTYSLTNVTNPSFTLSQGSNNPYTIYDPFTPNIQLQVMSANGCLAGTSNTLYTLQLPTAWFKKDKKEGCAPLVVKFSDLSTTLPNFPVTSYTWNNGAVPPIIVTGVGPVIQSQTFTYSAPGTYTPFLSIQTVGGCTDVSFIDTVTVVNPPGISNTFTPNLSVCAGVPVTINLSSVPANTNTIWHVTTDNGFFSGCVSNPSPSFPFTHVGVHGFTLSGSQSGCESTQVSTQTITVKGPFGQTRVTTNCTNRKAVLFDSYLQQVQTATLSFGDNTSVVITGNATGNVAHSITHNYAATGNYNATLTSVNPGNLCPTHVFTVPVTVRDVSASITVTNMVNGQVGFPTLPTGIACTSPLGVSNLVFNGSPSTDEFIGCRSGYKWFFYSPVTPTNIPSLYLEIPTASMSFQAPGIYTVALMVKDVNGCIDVSKRQFRVSSAKPDFTMTVNPICFSADSVHFINTTVPVYPDVVTNFTWDYDDFTTYSTPQVTVNPPHHYTAQSVQPPGHTFNVVLTATNSLGCISATSHTLRVNNPSAQFNSSKDVVCIPGFVTFTCPPPIYVNYKINYSDSTAGALNTTTVNTFRHKYITSGTHSVTLKVTDSSGCFNSYTKPIIAQVTPTASFMAVNPNYCIPNTITYTSTSITSDPINSPIVNYSWNFGSGYIPTSTPSAAIAFPSGTTAISFIASPAGGYCADTSFSTVYMYDTHATLVLNKTKFCIGDQIVATLTDLQDAQSWICNVGFGIQASQDSVPATQALVHTYSNTIQTGSDFVIATVTSPHNSCTLSTNPIAIEIIKVNPDFKRNDEIAVKDSIHCVKIGDVFTHGINTTTTALVYDWDFGNGQGTTAPNPAYTYTAPGVYAVHLTVSNTEVGCTASSTKNMTINPLPTMTISSGDNCPGSTFLLKVNGSPGIVSSTWAPAQNMVSPPSFTIPPASPSAFQATATANASTIFSLSVTDIFGCVSEQDTQHVFVQPPSFAVDKDTTIVIGELVPINMYAGPGFSYTWTPVFTDLSCTNCYSPTSTSTLNITYTVIITDNLGCSAVSNRYKIIIEPKTSVDVPTAFTPNGDGINDIIYAAGWGIKSLKFFRVYNRWGEMLFESTDIKTGWNGYFNGIPQNMETYVYQVQVETYVDEKPIFKTGTFKLIR